MLNVFTTIKTYAGKWSEKSRRAFTAEEISSVKSAVVVASDYGSSVCFHMNDGGYKYIPCSTASKLVIGQTVDVTKAVLVTLQKEGEADIHRIE